jgi:hypothetical protein
VNNTAYDEITKEILHTNTGHSSVAGEQPKFACFDGISHLIVKYSPALSSHNPVAERFRDLLICEHFALKHWLTMMYQRLIQKWFYLSVSI